MGRVVAFAVRSTGVLLGVICLVAAATWAMTTIDILWGRGALWAFIAILAAMLAAFARLIAIEWRRLRRARAVLASSAAFGSVAAERATPAFASSQPAIELNSATRLSKDDFWTKSALGLSLQRLAHDSRIVPNIAFENQRALADVFNPRITSPDNYDLLIFVHDDVWIDDYFLADRVIEGLNAFSVIGVAGNRRRIQNQPAWLFVDEQLTMDSKTNLSGSVAHGTNPFGHVNVFGPVPAECELLDGVFLAARRSALRKSEVLFDPRFLFHFYDMDFCRSAREKGLRLGTWPICLTHQSVGIFGSPAWAEGRRLYFDKWKN